MRVRTKQLIEERVDGGSPTTYPKDSVWNVSKETGERWVKDGLAEIDEDKPIGKAKIALSVTKNDASVSVSGYCDPQGSLPEGAVPQLRLQALDGVSVFTGPGLKQWSPSTSIWIFPRPKNGSDAKATFISQCHGFEPEELTVVIPEQDHKDASTTAAPKRSTSSAKAGATAE